MLDSLPLPSSMAQFKEEPKNVPGQSQGKIGTTLRGVLDFYGYAFLIEMDRQGWTKTFKNNTFEKSYWQAVGKMSVKLLRFPANPDDQETKGRKFMQCDLQDILSKGFVGNILLVGWFDDLTMHFRGRAQAQQVLSGTPFFEWMTHMYMPWREVDIRFDDQGAHVRMDWQMDKESVRGFFKSIGKAMKDKEVRYGLFRMDALPNKDEELPDPTKTYVAMTYSRNILASYTLRMDECTGSSDNFKCVLEQRPLSATISSLYRDPPYENIGKGLWFTFIGTIGRLQLNFRKSDDGNYVASPEKSWCAGFNPCPFIVMEPFKAQFLDKQLIMEQTDQGLQTKMVFFFYPIFDQELATAHPGINYEGWSEKNKSIPCKIKPKRDENGEMPPCDCPDSTDDVMPAPASGSGDGDPICTAKGGPCVTKIREMEDEIEDLKASIIELNRQKRGKDMISTKGKRAIKLAPGEDLVIESDYT